MQNSTRTGRENPTEGQPLAETKAANSQVSLGDSPISHLEGPAQAPQKTDQSKGSNQPKAPPDRSKTAQSLLEHVDKIVALVISLVAGVLPLPDVQFRILWALLILVGVGFVWYLWKNITPRRVLWLVLTVIPLALISLGLHDAVTQPTFSLQIAGSTNTITTQRILWFTYRTPFFARPETFEVTDNLIRAKAEVTLTKADRDQKIKEKSSER